MSYERRKEVGEQGKVVAVGTYIELDLQGGESEALLGEQVL